MRNRPYRVRKEGGLMSSLFGVLIGLLFIVILSPVAAWYAESQHRAEDFSSAKQVEATSNETGYIVIEDTAKAEEKLSCPVKSNEEAVTNTNSNTEVVTDKECLYVEETKEAYTRVEKETCGRLSSNQEELRYLGDECDSDGTNCEPCYLVAEYDWEVQDTTSNFVDFKLGDYTVAGSDSTNFIGTKSLMNYEFLYDDLDDDELDEYAYEDDLYDGEYGVDGEYMVGDLRYSYEYLESDQTLLVAGNAENNTIKSAYEGKPFVISNLSYQGTLEDLESQDTASKWGLRIASLVLMVIGMVLLAGPLTVFTNVFRFIPFIGKRADKGIDAVISFVAALIGVVVWLIVFLGVLLLKNILLVLGVLVVIGIVIVVLVMKGKKNTASSESSATLPPDKPSVN